jgi:hypothetical protein
MKSVSWEYQQLPAMPLSDPDITVTGKVISQNGSAVPNVEVFAFSGASQKHTYTDGNGEYILSLSAGIYDIVFHPPLMSGLASQARRWIRVSQTLNITLPPGYIVSGQVYSDAAKLHPVKNASIFAFNLDTFIGFGISSTLSTGAYTLSLEAGQWELTFSPPHFVGLGPTRTEVIVPPAITGLDIILPDGFTIQGRVLTNGVGVPNVEIFAKDPSQLAGFGFSPTDSNGYYTGTVPLGKFDILFMAPPSQNLGSTVATNVMGPDDVELNIILPTGYTIAGSVRCGATPVPNAFVEARPHLPLSAGHFSSWGDFAGGDGYYALALQPGDYTFVVSPPKNSGFSQLIMPGKFKVQQDFTIIFDYCTIYLPSIVKSAR